MTVRERLQAVLDYLDMGTTTLAVKCGLKKGKISDMIRTDAKTMPYFVAESISRKFPSISEDWLMNGEGEMLNTSLPENDRTKKLKKLNTETSALEKALSAFTATQQQILAELAAQRQLLTRLLQKDGDTSTPAYLAEAETDKQKVKKV